jgi:hypothetical protein
MAFDPALLDRLTSALTEYLGAGACIVVAKAAEGALDVNQLCMSLASHVPSAKRMRFLDGIGDLLRAGPSAPLTPEILAEAVHRLAQHIGPLARVLVDKEARRAANPAELYARLAEHVHDAEARKTFLATAPRRR